MPCRLHFVEGDYSSRSVVGEEGLRQQCGPQASDLDGIDCQTRSGAKGVRAPVTSCWTQRFRAWVSNSSSQGSSWARESLARVWVGWKVWDADMVGWLDGWRDESS